MSARPATFGGGYDGEARPRMGFFTDTSICIGCKACEVACKEWNLLPQDGPLSFTSNSLDNTMALGASTWRHVAFIEQARAVPVPDLDLAALAERAAGDQAAGATSGMPEVGGGSMVEAVGPARDGIRWLMSSDVCKHCSSAACLEVCPTGALFRTEFGTVVVQADICNGCGYCVPACPFGVIDRREDDGRAWKCTLCYDRLRDDLEPACAHACPTKSIQFGQLDELQARADERLDDLHRAGVDSAQLYLRDEADGVGGAGAFFLLLDEPEVYGFPPDPVSTTRDLPAFWKAAGLAAGALVAGLAAAFAGGRR